MKLNLLILTAFLARVSGDLSWTHAYYYGNKYFRMTKTSEWQTSPTKGFKEKDPKYAINRYTKTSENGFGLYFKDVNGTMCDGTRNWTCSDDGLVIFNVDFDFRGLKYRWCARRK